MGFDELRNTLKEVVTETIRMDCDNLYEAVVAKEHLSPLTQRLQRFFGAPAWPSKVALSAAVQEAIRSYGGVMPGQTLYFLQREGNTFFAMLWPWQDGQRTTLKVVRQ
jgi:hypothetical protein